MLSKNIRKARFERGFTQGDLGKKLGVLHNTVSNYETGRVVPDGEMLKKIAETLGVSVDALLALEEPSGVADVRTRTEVNEQDKEAQMLKVISSQQETIAKLVTMLGGGEK